MKTYFAVKNETGETWPAYGMARLGPVIQYDGVNNDVPLYTLEKPDGTTGIYIVNGVGPLENTKEGTGIHYMDAQYVAVESDETAADVGVTIGAIADQWTAGSGEGNGSQFKAVDGKNDANIIPVTALATSTTSGGDVGSGGACACTCIDNGDMLISGIETTSRWSVSMSEQVFKQTNGDIVLPAQTHILAWDAVLGKWNKDIGDSLGARYLDGTYATSASTLDGTLALSWSGPGTAPSLTLCVDGTIPPKSGS